MGIVVITFLRVIRFLNFLGLEILVFLKEITYLKLSNLRIVYRSVPEKMHVYVQFVLLYICSMLSAETATRVMNVIK